MIFQTKKLKEGIDNLEKLIVLLDKKIALLEQDFRRLRWGWMSVGMVFTGFVCQLLIATLAKK